MNTSYVRPLLTLFRRDQSNSGDRKCRYGPATEHSHFLDKVERDAGHDEHQHLQSTTIASQPSRSHNAVGAQPHTGCNQYEQAYDPVANDLSKDQPPNKMNVRPVGNVLHCAYSKVPLRASPRTGVLVLLVITGVDDGNVHDLTGESDR
jgi:hypothetical protein